YPDVRRCFLQVPQIPFHLTWFLTFACPQEVGSTSPFGPLILPIRRKFAPTLERAKVSHAKFQKCIVQQRLIAEMFHQFPITGIMIQIQNQFSDFEENRHAAKTDYT